MAEASANFSNGWPSLKPNVSLTAAPRESDSTLGMIGGLLLGVFTIIPSLLYWVISFVTYTLPTWLFTFLSTSLTFTMNMTTLLLLLVAFASTISWFVRYRFMNMYSRLPPEPQRKEPQIEIFPDAQETDSKPGLANYFDEFLSAIKVFGYLERPVFHELTRTMQTRKLIAGETLLLEEEKGFCLVVDGLVQIFVKSNREAEMDSSNDNSFTEDDHHEERTDGNRHYQLLTEVKNGAPMSSLFSVLSLFTDDVKLRFDEDDETAEAHSATHPKHPFDGTMTPESGNHSPAPWNSSNSRPVSSHKRLSTLNAGGSAYRDPPPLTLDGNGHHGEEANQHPSRQPSFMRSSSFQRKKAKKHFSAHPDIVARATVDTTIAIIPASAFHRITRIYPKATAHIVQVILTRLQRVTLSTGHSYLGLTSEVLRMEKLMDKYTSYDLPDFLRGEAIQRLKDKFRKDQERIGPEESMKGIALHNPRVAQRRRRTSSNLRRDAAFHAKSGAGKGTASAGELDDRNGVSAGDLLTNIHAARTPGRKRQFSDFSQPYSAPKTANGDVHSPSVKHNKDPFDVNDSPRAHMHRQESMDEDVLFRDSIMECMVKAIGLTNNQNVKRAESVAQSPQLVSFDSRSKTAVFNNAFGFIDSYEGSMEDSESGVSMSNFSMAGSPNTMEFLKDDIEIVYFPKGSVLVEEGERNPGLYYVIDGFLDVSASVDEMNQDQNVLGTLASSSAVGLPELFGTTPDSRKSGSKRSTSSSTRDQSRRRKQGRKSLFLIKPGGLAGYLGTVSSYRSFIDVTAKTDVYVGFLPRIAIERIVERHPIVLLTMAKRLTTLLPRLILHIDFALEWLQVNSGQVLYHQKDESAADLMDADDTDALHDMTKEEASRKRIAAAQRERDLKKKLGEMGNGMGAEYLRATHDSTSTKLTATSETRSSEGQYFEKPSASELGLLGKKASDQHLSPAKDRKRHFGTGAISSAGPEAIGWGGARKAGILQPKESRLGSPEKGQTKLKPGIVRGRSEDGSLSPKKRARFALEKGIREPGRESLGEELKRLLADDDDELDIV